MPLPATQVLTAETAVPLVTVKDGSFCVMRQLHTIQAAVCQQHAVSQGY